MLDIGICSLMLATVTVASIYISLRRFAKQGD